MPESREVFIDKLMTHITRLAMVPKVQVERAVAPILGLFIAKLLSQKWGKQIEVICEEFPLRKAIDTCQSTNIDWLLYNSDDNQLIFLELKTVDTSFDPRQKEIYLELIKRIGETGLSFLEEDLKEIRRNSLEANKYTETLSCISKCIEKNPRYSDCRKGKLVYLAPAAMKEAQKEPPENEIEWLSFQDLPEKISGELAVEWSIIRRALLGFDNSTQHFRNRPQEVGGLRNYGETCGFEKLTELCEANGDSIVVGFVGGARAVRAATLAELKKRNFKWDRVERGTGVKDPRNWIPGETFLRLIEPLMEECQEDTT